jgi:hypothetical protein
LGQAILTVPANATRVPASKDRRAYTRAIDRLYSAWWARNFDSFERAFQHVDVDDPFNGRLLFDARYADSALRFRGPLLFNGASAVVQIVTPQGPDHEHGIGGGYAMADLFLVKFFPGIDVPVIEKLVFIDTDLLAAAEWKKLHEARR